MTLTSSNGETVHAGGVDAENWHLAVAALVNPYAKDGEVFAQSYNGLTGFPLAGQDRQTGVVYSNLHRAPVWTFEVEHAA